MTDKKPVSEKDKLIKKEMSKYKKIFKDIEEDKKPFAEKLYSRAAFMAVTLDELQEKVNREGAVIECKNGNGFVTKAEHPAQKSFNTMIKNYNATIKSLIDLVPNDTKEGDELLDFIGGKK